MQVEQLLKRLMETVYGTIILGAVGSLLATVLAYTIRRIFASIERRHKADQWTFGWMSAFCTDDLRHQPVFFSFMLARVMRIVLLCVLTIIAVSIYFYTFIMIDSLSVYLASTLIFSIGLAAFWTAYSDYSLTRQSVNWWIAELKKRKNR